jgi:hypothetical protein
MRSAWRMALMPLMGGVLMCAVAATVAGGVAWLADNIAREQGQAQAALLTAEQTLKNTQLDMARLDDNLQTYDKLKQSGFLGVQDRLGLLEALEDAAKELRQSAVEWELGPEEKMQVLIDNQTGATVSQLMRIPMKLTASGIHEEEWLQLLTRLQASGAGSFVTNTCVYEPQSYSTTRTAAPAVKVACDLSWLYVVAEGAKR